MGFKLGFTTDAPQADYKGEFMLADRRYCYPLTIADYQPLSVCG